jgi:bacteriocin-like protein
MRYIMSDHPKDHDQQEEKKDFVENVEESELSDEDLQNVAGGTGNDWWQGEDW